MFRTLQECMAELTGIEPREGPTLSTTDNQLTERKMYELTSGRTAASIMLTCMADIEVTRIYATMTRYSATMLGPVGEGCLFLADGVTLVPYARLRHHDPEYITASFTLYSHHPASHGRDILTQLLRVAYPDALMHT